MWVAIEQLQKELGREFRFLLEAGIFLGGFSSVGAQIQILCVFRCAAASLDPRLEEG